LSARSNGDHKRDDYKKEKGKKTVFKEIIIKTAKK